MRLRCWFRKGQQGLVMTMKMSGQDGLGDKISRGEQVKGTRGQGDGSTVYVTIEMTHNQSRKELLRVTLSPGYIPAGWKGVTPGLTDVCAEVR